MKILTVDDSALVRRMVKSSIASAGYDALEAANGQQALDVLSDHDDVALVVLDWNMPVMDGLTCLKEIRAGERTKTVPVMMLTTESQRDSMIAAIRAGANNYLSKPFRPEQLAVKIQQCLRATA